jgi:uncharacterized protein (DUF58 family)
MATLFSLLWRRPVVETGPVRLSARRLYILPTRPGLVFACLLLGLLVGAINYGLSLAYLFTFWFAAVAVVAMLYTQRNLSGLIVQAETAAPVFAGETAHFRLRVSHASRLARHGLRLDHRTGRGAPADISAAGEALLEMPLPQTRRGWHVPGRFAIASTWPLGLFRCWAVLELDWGVLVYPAPASVPLPLPESDEEAEAEGRSTGRDGQEYTGLRGYQPGDPPRRIAWKAAARGGEHLLSKTFAGSQDRRLWLAWRQAPETDVEARLARLTRWVLDAHAAGLPYGLKLPGRTLPPGTGEAHLRQCLEALARHGQ